MNLRSSFLRFGWLAVVGLAACSSLPINPVVRELETPEPNQPTLRKVGDVVVSSAQYEEKNAIQVREPIKILTVMGNPIETEAGTFVAETKNSFGISYASSNPVVWAGMKGFGGIVIPNNAREKPLIYTQIGYEYHKARLPENFTYYKTVVRKLIASKGRKEIIYSGRNGNILTFVIRCFPSEFEKPLERIAQFDVSTSPTFQCEGAKLQILEADNFHLRFLALSRSNE